MKLLLYGIMLIWAMNGIDKCDDTDVKEEAVKLGEVFDLELEKTAIIIEEKLGITFSNNQDSRCPLHVSCIQAGKAKITVQLTKKEKTESVVLEAKGLCHKEDGSCGESKSLLGYNLKLMAVNPYPGSPEADKKEPVKLKLMITKE